MTSAEIVTQVLLLLKDHTRPEVRTLTLNNLAASCITKAGGFSMLQGYKPPYAKFRFPTAIAIQVNNQIAQGIPSGYLLKKGDLVSYSVSIKKDGVCADGALTIGVGTITDRERLLIKQTRKTLYAGIKAIRPGVKVRQIAEAMERMAKAKGFVISHTFTGHGIGKEMYQPPAIYQCRNWLHNYPEEYKKMEILMEEELKEGQMICLEPYLTEKDAFGRLTPNGFTFVTRDRAKSAVFEHTLLVTRDGCKILTNHIC